MRTQKKSTPLEVCLMGVFSIVLGWLAIVVVPKPASDFSDFTFGVALIISGVYVPILNFFRSTDQLQATGLRFQNFVQSKVFSGLIVGLIVASALFGIVAAILEMLGE